MHPTDAEIKDSITNEHNDLAAIMFYAVQLELACGKYLQDAISDTVHFVERSPDEFNAFRDAINALLVPAAAVAGVPPADPPLLNLQHQLNVRVQVIPAKNGGFA